MLEVNTAEDQPATPAVKPARQWLKFTAFATAGLVALAVGMTAALWWWAGTDGSLATALRWISQSQPLTVERVTGSLRAGGHIGQLRWHKTALASPPAM